LASGTSTPAATAAARTTSGASPAALAYLTYAVDYIQQHGLHSDKVDWTAVRAHVFGPQVTAQTTADTYPSIRYVLGQLPVNHHSYLVTPEQARADASALAAVLGFTANYAKRKVITVDEDSPAAKAGLRVGDTIVSVNDSPVRSLDATKFFAQLYFGSDVRLGLVRGNQSITVQINHDPVDPTSLIRGRRLANNIGYIALPGAPAIPTNRYYAGITQQIIADIDSAPTCGWVVDLQGNTGGSIGPMLDGVGPILGEGQVASFVGAEGSEPVTYRNGQSSVGDRVFEQVAAPYHLQRPNPPVAVLTDNHTASAAEFVLVAFRGRPDTRSFGEDTYGVPTANDIVPLSDGAELVLTEAMDADRTGHVYDGKIAPDQTATANAFWRGKDQDSVLQAGVAWLKQQPACAGR
jgi:C-terminal processing protease CtpA/Prc